jgi:hypothetical protein
MDKDGSGELSQEEVKHFLVLMSKMSGEDCTHLNLDTDGDGTVEHHEFREELAKFFLKKDAQKFKN